MLNWLEGSQPRLEQVALRVLREHVSDHGMALAPFRLPALAKQVLVELGRSLRGEASAAPLAFGEQLGAQGLGLRAWLAVGQALMVEFAAAATGAAEDVGPVLLRLHEFVTHAVDGLARRKLAELSQQRDEIHGALQRVIHTREAELHQVIRELSTPVMPVHAQILVVPLIGRVDAERARRITDRLLDETTRRQARILIIDVTGLATSDGEVFSALTRAMQAVQLIGARAVLVGIPAEMARTLVELDGALAGFSTMADLQSGIAWALNELGLAIQPRALADRRSERHGE